MKKFLFSLIFLLVSYVGFSQKGLSYQAVILDPNKIEVPGQDISGQPLVNGDVWMKFSIYNGSTLQFEEVHKTKTDNYGLVNLLIGSVSSGSFNSLVWDSSQKSLYVYASFDQGGSYTKISEQKLTYSPYTLFAETAGKLGGVLGIASGGTGATTVADARLNLGLDQVNNTSDAVKPVSTATQAALDLKANNADVNASLALKADTTYVLAKVAAATITDADATTKGKIQLAGDLAGTADAPTVPGLALKANTTDVTTALDLKANTADMASALALKANGTTVANSLNLKENAANKSLNVNSDGTSDVKYPSVKAVKEYVDARVQSGGGSSNVTDADATTKGIIRLAGDLGGTADTPTVPGLVLKANTADVTSLTNVVTTNTASITANSSAIAAETTRATAAELTLANNVTANTASITANSTAINSKAPLASPTFSGAVTAPIYASTPQALTDGSTISWDPSLGLNASVTLGGNRTLSFLTTPVAGAYGTLVVTQDGTGNRTLTLPSTTNKVLGSTSTTAIALSTAAGASDIINFYFDGTNCYWNVGQGYGTAAAASTTNLATGVTGTLAVGNGGTGATTLTGLVKGNGTSAMTAATAGTDYLAPNGSAASLTNFPTFNQNTTGNAANVTGTVAVANGGTGATTLTGIVKGNGTGAMTVATAGTDYQAPITLTTTGTGAATLSGTTLNIPAVSSTVNSNTLSGTVAVVNGGTGATSKTSAFDALSPMTTAGDLIYGGTSGTGVRLGKGNNGTVLTMENNIPTWLTSIRATAGSSYNAAVGFSFLGGDWARNTGMFSDNPDSGGSATLKFRIATSNGTADPYLEISPSKVSIYPTTSSTSKSTGALTVAGGLGVTGDIYASNLNTSGTITSGAVTYPIAHGTSGQMLTTTGSGTLSWTTPASPGVPYTGATGAVNLGAYNLTVSSFTIGQGKTPASGDNLAIGRSALNNTTSNGWPNIGLGSFSLNQTTDGKNNIGVGLNALYANTTGSYNIGIGTEAARNASTSSNITAIGMEALKYESGAGNTAVGSYAGKPSTDAVYSGTTNSTFLGYNTTTGKTADATITNSTAIGYGASVTASHTIQLGNTSVTNVKTSGAITAGDVTYPKTHGTANQVLTTTGSGTLTFTTPTVAKPISDQFTATAAQTSFTLTQTPITNTTVSPNVKPNVWMYINGIRTNNLAYSVSGTTVTYTASSNNNYTIVVGDRIQFDYAY